MPGGLFPKKSERRHYKWFLLFHEIEPDGPTGLQPDVELLEDLIIAGVNKALDEAAVVANEEMTKTAGGFLPPGFDPGKLGI